MMMRFFTKTYSDSPWVEISPRDSSASARWDPRQWRSWWPVWIAVFGRHKFFTHQKESPRLFKGGWLVDDMCIYLYIHIYILTKSILNSKSARVHNVIHYPLHRIGCGPHSKLGYKAGLWYDFVLFSLLTIRSFRSPPGICLQSSALQPSIIQRLTSKLSVLFMASCHTPAWPGKLKRRMQRPNLSKEMDRNGPQKKQRDFEAQLGWRAAFVAILFFHQPFGGGPLKQDDSYLIFDRGLAIRQEQQD